jgi:hypothetical protein
MSVPGPGVLRFKTEPSEGARLSSCLFPLILVCISFIAHDAHREGF